MSLDRNVNTYRCLSKLYPKSFRDEYGHDLIATFAEQLRDERTGRVWLTTIRDLAVTLKEMLDRLNQLGRKRTPRITQHWREH